MARRYRRLLLTISTAVAVTASSGAEPPGRGDQPAPLANEGTVMNVGSLEVVPPEGHGSLRVLTAEEVTPPVVLVAQRILREHRGRPLGYEVPFELEGKRYVGRLERHYRAPGSHGRPVGEHVGVTVYRAQ